MEKKEDNIIYITSNVNEIFASTELIQYFTNPLDNPKNYPSNFQSGMTFPSVNLWFQWITK